MKHLFLTSSVHAVAHQVAADIGPSVRGMKLAFIRTAAEVEDGGLEWLEADRAALVAAGFTVTDTTFTNKSATELRDELGQYDALYVEGGNTFYLLQQMQQSGALDVIRDLVSQKNILYIGTSAGSIVAGPDIAATQHLDSLEKAPLLDGTLGLNIVPFIIFPHWGSEYFKELYFSKRMNDAYDCKHPIILLRDSMYVEVKDEWYQIKRAKRAS